MRAISFILIGLLLSVNARAEDAVTMKNSQFADWSCYFRAGVLPESYAVSSYADNIYAEGSRHYNMLCTFDYKFSVNNSPYALQILFPDCLFSSDNQLIMTKLVEISNNYAEMAADKYTLSFPPNETVFTGADINQDQNAKLVFFNNIISSNNMHLSIQNIGEVDVNLDGIEQGMQVPYCNK